MGGVKFNIELHICMIRKKKSHKIIKKYAHTQYVHAFFYSKYLFYVIFYAK